MSDEERMDAVLRQMAVEEYNRPPHIVPREQMWDAVQQGLGTGDKGLGAGRFGVSRVNRVPRWVYLAVAAVLLLAVGIQVGRVLGPGGSLKGKGSEMAFPDSLGPDSTSSGVNIVGTDPRSDDGKGGPRPRPRPEPELAARDLAESANRAYSLVAAQHLTQAEALLTAFKGDLNQGRMDTQMASWGKELLSNTRLLLDSPVATTDPVRRKLLQDLELVLVQIVQLSPNTSARDRDFIKGALTDDEVLTRLRTAIPAQKGTCGLRPWR